MTRFERALARARANVGEAHAALARHALEVARRAMVAYRDEVCRAELEHLERRALKDRGGNFGDPGN